MKDKCYMCGGSGTIIGSDHVQDCPTCHGHGYVHVSSPLDTVNACPGCGSMNGIHPGTCDVGQLIIRATRRENILQPVISVVRQKLLDRGFTEEQYINNRGIIGAAIDETLLHMRK